MDGTKRHTVSASLTSLSVGAPNVVPLFATCSRRRKIFPFACPKISGPQDPTKSIYCFPSASVIRDPRPRSINFGAPPTAFHARTGLLTPPGIFSRARLKNCLDLFGDIGATLVTPQVVKCQGD